MVNHQVDATFKVSDFAIKKRKKGHIYGLIGHLHDGFILLPRPECFVKMLSYSNFSSLLGIKIQLEKLASR